MPLPCSPASYSERGDSSRSQSASECESESDLITPRAGPSNPALRTHANLSTPLAPFVSFSSDHKDQFYDFTSESEPERVKRDVYKSTETSDVEEPSTVHPAAHPPAVHTSSASALSPIQEDKPTVATASTSEEKDTQDHVETGGHPPELYAKPSDIPQSKKKKSPRSSPRTSPGRRSKLSPRASPRHSPEPGSRWSSPKQSSKLWTPNNSNSERLHPPLVTRRSITFCPTSAKGTDGSDSISSSVMSRHNSSHRGRGREDMESSADEGTAIARRKKGVGTYGATDTERATAHAGYDGAGEEELTRELTPVERRIKSGASSKAGGGRPSRGPRRSSAGTGSVDSPSDEETEHEGFWKSLVDNYGSVELENKGSVARDHLALERTFLAWLRTSLSFASIGIAITQLFRLNTAISDDDGDDGSGSVSSKGVSKVDKNKLRKLGKPLGATFLGVSILVLLLGFHRYFESQHYVIRGKFPASRGSIVIVSFVAGALMVASMVVVVAIAPSAFET